MVRRVLASLALLAALACVGCARGETGKPFTVSGTQAHLDGRVGSNTGGTVEYWVQYGPTTAYGAESPHETIETEPNTPRDVFPILTGLQRDTGYHYRLCAQDLQQQGGPGCGEDRTFITSNLDCGEVITHDFRLSRSMSCEFFEPGILIGADGVDINLAGHTFTGSLDVFQEPAGPPAVDNSGGFDDVTIRNGTIDSWGTVALLENASRNVIRNIGTTFTGSGVRIVGGADNTIRSSSFTAGRFGDALFAEDTVGLTVTRSWGHDWLLRVSGARLADNDMCVVTLQGNDNLLKGNRVRNCLDRGVAVSGGSGNRLVGNEVSGLESMFSTDTDGIRVEVAATGTVLRDNFVHDNPDDGIDVRAPGTTLTGNRATNNGDLGIDAVPGVTDGGRNTASGNGNPLQCRNVACSPAH